MNGRPPRSTLFPTPPLSQSGKRFESQPITVGAESRHYANGKIREQRAPPLRLAGEDVGEMHFHKRHAHREQRVRSEEHTSELQSPCNLVCRLLLEKKKDLKR